MSSSSSPKYVTHSLVGAAISRAGCERATPLATVACLFTRGNRRTVKSAERVVIGKAYLVSRLVSLFESGRLHLPRGSAEAAALAQELRGYEIRVGSSGTDRYGAFRTGTHDDLVTALGLAVHADPLAMASQVLPALAPLQPSGGISETIR